MSKPDPLDVYVGLPERMVEAALAFVSQADPGLFREAVAYAMEAEASRARWLVGQPCHIASVVMAR